MPWYFGKFTNQNHRRSQTGQATDAVLMRWSSTQQSKRFYEARSLGKLTQRLF